MTRWEYAAISWVYSTNQDGENSTWRQVYWIYWPDGAVEQRLGWTSEDTDGQTTTLLELENELGADGWELVAVNVLDSIIMNTKYGWPSVGIPVSRSWTFKRPAAE